MKKIGALALAALLALFALPALGDSEGVIVQSSCSIVQSGEYYLVYCYAQAHNNSDSVICLERGSFDLQDGETLLATSPVAQLWPYFLSPGEDGYLFDIVSFEPDENGNPVMPRISGISYEIDYMTVDPAFASRDLQAVSTLEMDAAGDMAIVCRLTNGSDTDAYDPTVAFGLYTESGAMLYADGATLKGVGIPAGGTMLARFYVDDVILGQWLQAGESFAPVEARVNAAFRNDED